jgi:hypothetical protein
MAGGITSPQREHHGASAWRNAAAEHVAVTSPQREHHGASAWRNAAAEYVNQGIIFAFVLKNKKLRERMLRLLPQRSR